MEGFLVGGGVGFLAEGVEQMLLVLCPLGTQGQQLQLSGQLLDTQGTPHPKSLPLCLPEGFFWPQECVWSGGRSEVLENSYIWTQSSTSQGRSR